MQMSMTTSEKGMMIASNNSACGGDAAAYLTGARTRFGSHLIDPKLKESDFVVKRVSTGKTVRVVINAATYPHDVRTQMKNPDYTWPAPPCKDMGRRRDNDYRNVPEAR